MKLWFKVFISVGVLTLLFALLPWQEVRQAASHVSLVVWILVLGGFVAGHFLGIAKWRTLLNTGRAHLRPVDAVRCYAAGLFANLCLPSIVGGDVLRATLAGKTTGRPEAAAFGGVVDRVLDMVASGLLIGAGGILAGGALSGWRMQLVGLSLLIGMCGGLAFLPLVLQRPLARYPARYRRPAGRSLVALRRLWRSPGTASKALLMSLLIQTGFVLLNAWIGHSVGISVPLAVWFLAWPLAKAAGLLPISLGGLGVRDATLAALLVPFGVPAAHGLVASLIWQSVLIGGGLLGGLAWWLLSRTHAGAWQGHARFLDTGSSRRSHV
jgi:glycosyltransferase 2 family protein